MLSAWSLIHSGACLAAATAAAVGGAAAARSRLPKAGPGRAAWLALSSRLAWRGGDTVASQRDDEVAALRAALEVAGRDRFVVVTGPTGVGKSCLVDTAVRAGSYGAVHVTVPAGEPAGDIVAAVHAATAGMRVPSPPGSAANPAPSAGRVLAAYALLFGAPVVAVLRAEPHGDGRRYAEAPAAARQLAAFGYRVVVDAAHRALDTAPTAMARSEYVDIAVEPMPRALVERLAGLAPLHAALAAARLADVVWAVAGGYPAAYEQLHTAWAEAGGSSAAITPTVQTFVERKLGDALDLRDCADRCYAPLFERFRAVDAVPAAEARALLPLLPGATPWPPPDGVLRAVRGGRSDARAQQQLLLLVPASPAVGVVLRHGLARVPPLAALAAMVAAEAA